MAEPVGIAAATEIKPGRYPDSTADDFYRQIFKQLLSEYPIGPGDIGGLLVSPPGMAAGSGADIFAHEHLAEELALKTCFAETLNAGGATHGVMVQRAALAIRAGLTDGILCIAAGTFPKVGDGGAEAIVKMVSHPEFDSLYGSYIPPLYAQAATRHMHEFGTTKTQLAKVAVASRAWALKHPDALMRRHGPITVEDVLESRPIASPFNLLDCSVPCDGGSALLICGETLAKRIDPQPAWVLGFGEAHEFFNISQCRDLINMGGKKCGDQAYAMAGLSANDLDFLELYDSFSFNPILGVENLGVVPPGQGGRFWDEGRGAPGGDLPVNTYGGLLSFGHTGDASGMSMIVEGARQVMGRAGERQLSKADIGLVHSYGGMMAEHSVLILGRQS